MTAVWYLGTADIRIVTSAEWQRAGVGGVGDSVWNSGNGWSIPASNFTAGQLALLGASSDFNINAADGARPGAQVTRPVTYTPTAANLLATQNNEGILQRALRRYHYALAARNSEPCDIFFAANDSLGDSAGVTTYANKLAQKFIAYHRQVHPQTAAGGPGLMSAAVPTINTGAPAPDAPQAGTVGGIFSPFNNVPGWGLDSATAFLASSGQSRQWTFTGTDIDLNWFSTGVAAGAAALTVDGTNYGTYNTGTGALTAGAGNIVQANTGVITLAHGRVSGLAAGSHVVKFTWVSGTFYLHHAFGYNGDLNSGARIALQGYGGRGLNNFVGTVYGTPAATNPLPLAGQAEQFRKTIRDGWYLPDLVFLPSWANDAFGTANDLQSANVAYLAAQQYIANMKADVAAGCAAISATPYIPSFVTVPAHCISNAKPGFASGNGGIVVDTWQSYVSAQYALAANDPDGAVAVFDLGARIQGTSNNWDQSRYNGLLSSDLIHPGNEGTDWMARALVDYVRPR